MYIIKPINDIKKRKGDGEKHSGPLVYGVHVRQVGDLHFELRGSPADAPFGGRPVPVQTAPEALAAAQRLAVLDAGTVVRVHGGLGVTHTREHLGAAGLVPDFQGAEENIAMGIDLDLVHLQFVLFIGTLVLFARSLLLRAFSKENVIDESVFQESQEHKHETPHEIDIDCLDVGDLWQSLPEVSADGRHCQHRGDS